MITIEYKSKIDKNIDTMINEEFNIYAKKNEVNCQYQSFNFIAKDDQKIIGVITGHSYYREVHISDLIVLEDYRHKHIGTKLISAVEDRFRQKDFQHMNVTTYAFQAPEFYKKCGFQVEFIRKDKENSKFDKYFLIKYF